MTIVTAHDVLSQLHQTNFALFVFGLCNDICYREPGITLACGHLSVYGNNLIFPGEEQSWHVSVCTGQDHVVGYIAIALRIYQDGIELLGHSEERWAITLVPSVMVTFRAINRTGNVRTVDFVQSHATGIARGPTHMLTRMLQDTTSGWLMNEFFSTKPYDLRQLGWHTGTVQVREVQPAPIPAKPVPIWVWVQTRTTRTRGFL